jgi:hypothetical protein
MARPCGCDYPVHVHIDVVAPAKKTRGRQPQTGRRHFIVHFNEDGEALRIYERKAYDHGPGAGAGFYNHYYWKAGTHPKTWLPAQIIATALLKTAEEHRSANATP